jgi:hypothetical protein
MDRLWGPTLVLGLLLAGIWWQANLGSIIPVNVKTEIWVYVASLVVLAFTLFALLGRRMGYVQAFRNHLRVVTPFLRLKISYRRIRSVHPEEFHKMFPPSKGTWAERALLEPFYDQTAVVVELFSYPISPAVLRLFLPTQRVHPPKIGLVFVVADWMAMSTELDSLFGDWQGVR